MESGGTSHSRTGLFTLRRPLGGSGFCSARLFRYVLLPRLTPTTFLQALLFAWQSPYSGCKNVIYRPERVICNAS
jgi:hypothetical protein